MTELRGTSIQTRGLAYTENAQLTGGPFDGQTATTSPAHDRLYIQNNVALWVYVKRSTDPGQPVYELDHAEPLPVMEP